jgi:VIT1/CCC1 family predicted Fe2+/Mn2+ transporter
MLDLFMPHITLQTALGTLHAEVEEKERRQREAASMEKQLEHERRETAGLRAELELGKAKQVRLRARSVTQRARSVTQRARGGQGEAGAAASS